MIRNDLPRLFWLKNGGKYYLLHTMDWLPEDADDLGYNPALVYINGIAAYEIVVNGRVCAYAPASVDRNQFRKGVICGILNAQDELLVHGTCKIFRKIIQQKSDDGLHRT